jgi:hypothetical protein
MGVRGVQYGYLGGVIAAGSGGGKTAVRFCLRHSPFRRILLPVLPLEPALMGLLRKFHATPEGMLVLLVQLSAAKCTGNQGWLEDVRVNSFSNDSTSTIQNDNDTLYLPRYS